MLQDPSARRRGGGGSGGGGVGTLHQEVRVPQDPSTNFQALESKIPQQFLLLQLTNDQESMPNNRTTPSDINEKNGDLIHHKDELFPAISCVSPNYESDNISIPLPSPEKKDDRFPVEKWKALIAFMFFHASAMATYTSLALLHDRLPSTAPLPDIMFDLLPRADWALEASEIIMIISLLIALLCIIFHKHRFIVLRRIFLITGMLFFMRSITIYVTRVPVANLTYYCSPKENSTSVLMIVRRVMKLNSGYGISLNGQHTYCGDNIFSGHTVVLTMFHLGISEYTPRRWFLFHWATWLSSSIGIIFLLVSRAHYTIDVIIAYYVTTRIFWIYHTMANNQILKEPKTKNLFTRLWWFYMFIYFERNVGGVVPRQFEWLLPWPRRWSRKSSAENC